MDPIEANELHIASITFEDLQVIVSPRPIDLAPTTSGSGGTKAWASLLG